MSNQSSQQQSIKAAQLSPFIQGVYAYFLDNETSLDVKHVAKFYLSWDILGHICQRFQRRIYIFDFHQPSKSKIHGSNGKYIEKVKYFCLKYHLPLFEIIFKSTGKKEKKQAYLIFLLLHF